MTGHQAGNPGYDDTELDRVVDTAMSGISAKLEAAFDPGAGLADIYARRTASSQPSLGRQILPASGAGSIASSRLAEVCDQLDLLTAWLADITDSGQHNSFSGSSYLDLARDNLVELRSGLASRTMSRPEAERLTSDIQNQLSQADRILRSRHGTTLDHLADDHSRRSGALTDQVRDIRESVDRLFEPDGRDLALIPAR